MQYIENAVYNVEFSFASERNVLVVEIPEKRNIGTFEIWCCRKIVKKRCQCKILMIIGLFSNTEIFYHGNRREDSKEKLYRQA